MSVDTNGSGGRPTLSVVVVTYNEADRIRACLQSVFDACCGLVEFEVVLVDSNSTDETCSYARAFPITVLRIPDDELTTPGAGRYVGTEAARGELLLFVDGDMVIERSWLERALEVMTTDDAIAGVDGHLNTSKATDPADVDAIRGVALYRAGPLRAVGGFDPHLLALEDIDLGFHLVDAGYRLVRLPDVAGNHPQRKPLFESVRRWRRGYMTGTGQVLRKSSGSPGLLARYLYRFRHRFILTGWLLAGLITLVSLPLFAGWLLLSTAGFAFVASRLGVVGGVDFCLSKFVGMAGLLRGLFVPTPDPESFPLEQVQRLQDGRIHSQAVSDVLPEISGS